MDGQYTARPTARAIGSIMVTDPPLIRLDCDDIENLLATFGDDIDWRNGSRRELLLPSLCNRCNVDLIVVGGAWFVAIPAGYGRISMPKVNSIPVGRIDFLAQGCCQFFAVGACDMS